MEWLVVGSYKVVGSTPDTLKWLPQWSFCASNATKHSQIDGWYQLAVVWWFTAKCLFVNSHQSHLKPTGHSCTSDTPKKPATGEPLFITSKLFVCIYDVWHPIWWVQFSDNFRLLSFNTFCTWAHSIFLVPPQSTINSYRYSFFVSTVFYGTLYHMLYWLSVRWSFVEPYIQCFALCCFMYSYL